MCDLLDAAEALELAVHAAPTLVPGVHWAHFLAFVDGQPPVLALAASGGAPPRPLSVSSPLAPR